MLLLRKLLKLFFPPFSNSKHVSLLRLLGTYLLGRCICTPLHRVLFSHKMNVNRDKKWEWSNVTNSDFTPLFLIFLYLQQRQRRREEVKEEEDNCRAFEATTPGNCDRQLWQNKNGQVYSHGIIVLANGSTSRALLGTTGLSFWFFLLEGEAEKILQLLPDSVFPQAILTGQK